MRQIVLDTETTGLEPELGHRIIEIGCVELIKRRRTGRSFHRYLRPGREIDEGAIAVHGLTQEFLADKPEFGDIAEEFMEFVVGAELIIHNAPFDMDFIASELRLMNWRAPGLDECCMVLDTLVLARELHPGQRNSLEALCRRYEVDDSARDYHGALLDAQILTDVYLAMTGGQATFELGERHALPGQQGFVSRPIERAGLNLVVLQASSEEQAAHRRQLEKIDKISGQRCIWLRREATAGEGTSGPPMA